MGLRIVLVSLLMSVVWMQNGVIGALEIRSDPPYAEVGSDVDIICDNTNPSGHNELQWRRSTDDVTDVQYALKIVDTRLTEPPTNIIYSIGINRSHFVPSKSGTEYILTIKDFNTVENDVYKYWCRFFQVPIITPDVVASLKIDLRVCVPSPCRNGGTCVSQSNGYRCYCPNQWTGTNCETSFRPLEISSPTPYADVGSHVGIICDKTDPSDHDEIQWRRSTDDVTDVQAAEKIVDTDMEITPSSRVFSVGINQSHFEVKKSGTACILIIKDFNTVENDVYKYWCRFFQVPAITPQVVASLKIDLRVAAVISNMAVIYKGTRYDNGASIDIDGEEATFTCEVIGTRPAAQISWTVSPSITLEEGDLVVTPNAMDSTLMDSRKDVTVNMGNLEEAKLTCTASTKQTLTPDAVLTISPKNRSFEPNGSKSVGSESRSLVIVVSLLFGFSIYSF